MDEANTSGRRFFFRRENRLTQRTDYLRVYDKGTLYRRTGLRIFILPADAPDAPTRLGITATRKVGNAVTRNRLRRLAREAFRLDLPDLPHGHIIVINFLPNAADLRLDALRSRLQSVWREAKLLNRDTGAGG